MFMLGAKHSPINSVSQLTRHLSAATTHWSAQSVPVPGLGEPVHEVPTHQLSAHPSTQCHHSRITSVPAAGLRHAVHVDQVVPRDDALQSVPSDTPLHSSTYAFFVG